MNQLTDALLLKESASRAKVAMLYGVVGIFVGVFFLSNNSD